MVRIIISVMTAGGYKGWVDVVVSRSMVASDSAGAGPDVVGPEVRFSLLELIGDQIPNPATRLGVASGLRYAERLGVCADGETSLLMSEAPDGINEDVSVMALLVTVDITSGTTLTDPNQARELVALAGVCGFSAW